eukprot:scaffold5797_cov115-Isochrysis_galbana.AAC.3
MHKYIIAKVRTCTDMRRRGNRGGGGQRVWHRLLRDGYGGRGGRDRSMRRGDGSRSSCRGRVGDGHDVRLEAGRRRQRLDSLSLIACH